MTTKSSPIGPCRHGYVLPATERTSPVTAPGGARHRPIEMSRDITGHKRPEEVF
jgi:hypothetical protein